MPSNAQNMNVTRPFCTTCAAVSMPLPVRSRYATRVGESTRNVSIPLGERLTWPLLSDGAVATKKTCCASTNARCSGLIVSYAWAIQRSSPSFTWA